MTLILALDIATRTGFARGRVGELPVSGSINFGRDGSSRNRTDAAIFAAALRWLSQELQPEPRPDLVIMEAMLPPDAARGSTQRAVRDRLAGLQGIVKGVSHLRGIGEIAEATVGNIRGHFIGDRSLKRAHRQAHGHGTLPGARLGMRRRQCRRCARALVLCLRADRSDMGAAGKPAVQPQASGGGSMSGIPFTQYFRPDGRTVARWIARPADIETAALRFIYAGGNYTAEILRTGEVSLAAVKQVGGELRDVELIICIMTRMSSPLSISWCCSRSRISGRQCPMTQNLLLILQSEG